MAQESIKVRQPSFSVSCTLTRPNDTTVYTAGDIINNNAATTLPYFDFTGMSAPCTKIQITSICILDEFGTAATKLQANMNMFTSDTLTGYTPTDNTPFAPTFAEVMSKKAGVLTGITTNSTFGTNAYVVCLSSQNLVCQIASDSKLYFALCPTNGYTPGAQKKLCVNISGLIL